MVAMESFSKGIDYHLSMKKIGERDKFCKEKVYYRPAKH